MLEWREKFNALDYTSFLCECSQRRREPVLIGKNKKPRCFAKLNDTSHPGGAYYFSNDNAWMDTEIMIHLLEKLNSCMKRVKRNIIKSFPLPVFRQCIMWYELQKSDHQLSNLHHYWIFVSASRLFASSLCCVFPLEYFLYPFYTGQQFYKLVSQSIFWLLMSSAKNKCGNTLWVSRGMFTCEMFQVCNHSFLISPLGMGFGHQNCVFVGCPNSGKRLNKWPKQTCSCMFKRDKYLRLWATI